jgi:hypothetical protein
LTVLIVEHLVQRQNLGRPADESVDVGGQLTGHDLKRVTGTNRRAIECTS